MIYFQAKAFHELTVDELYAILKLRSEVFIVEQQCVYQDVDGLDKKAIHYWLEEKGKILSYLRVFWRNQTIGQLQIGRVVSSIKRQGYGKELLNRVIESCYKNSEAKEVYIEAQCYAIPFYEQAGFKVFSHKFLEDGIPHLKMKLLLND